MCSLGHINGDGEPDTNARGTAPNDREKERATMHQSKGSAVTTEQRRRATRKTSQRPNAETTGTPNAAITTVPSQ